MARILIAGGHGQVALLLARHLADRGDQPVGLVRDPDHEEDLADHGAEMLVHDLEQDGVSDLADLLDGADAVVFAAGAGPGSGVDRKWTVDFLGAVALAEACVLAGVERYVMVSAMGTGEPPRGDDDFASYVRAKAWADVVVMASGLDWTVVRPGGLTDDEPTGLVALAPDVERGEVPRGDVAAVLAACLADDGSIGHVVELVSGDVPVEQAVGALGAWAELGGRLAPASGRRTASGCRLGRSDQQARHTPGG